MSQENVEVVVNALEKWNSGDDTGALEYFAADVEVHHNIGPARRWRASTKATWKCGSSGRTSASPSQKRDSTLASDRARRRRAGPWHSPAARHRQRCRGGQALWGFHRVEHGVGTRQLSGRSDQSRPSSCEAGSRPPLSLGVVLRDGFLLRRSTSPSTSDRPSWKRSLRHPANFFGYRLEKIWRWRGKVRPAGGAVHCTPRRLVRTARPGSSAARSDLSAWALDLVAGNQCPAASGAARRRGARGRSRAGNVVPGARAGARSRAGPLHGRS